MLKKLMGRRHVGTVTPTEFTSDFQDWMLNIRLAIIEEIREYGGHSSYNKVKHLFTEDEVPVNPKGKTRYQINNHVHFMFFSNHHYPIPLEDGDRRIHYVHSDVDAQEPEYYHELFAYLDLNGAGHGAWEFAKYLKDVVLPQVPDDFATKPPPRTKEHIAAVHAATNPIEDFIKERREDKYNFYAPGHIFHWKKLKDDLRGKSESGVTTGGQFGYILKNSHETASVLARCHITREWHMINSKRQDVCWFNDDKEFDEEVKRLFKDTSKEGRRLLNNLVYGSRHRPDPNHKRTFMDDLGK